MEARIITLTLDKAKEWYNSGNEVLKEAALQAYTENELKEFDFRSIKCFEDAVIDIYDTIPSHIIDTYDNIRKISKASAASFKLNIIRQALNKGCDMSFTEGKIWFPITPAVLPQHLYYKDSCEVETAKVRVGCDTFTLLGGGTCYGHNGGLGEFISDSGVACSGISIGSLGCATKEIAQHFGRYFAKEIFEAKYGDLIDYEWID